MGVLPNKLGFLFGGITTAALVECDDFNRTHKTLLNPRLSARAYLKVSVLIRGYYNDTVQ